MIDINVSGVMEGSRTLSVVVGTRRAWYDLDRELYAFEYKGNLNKFIGKSQIAEAITNLRQRTTPKQLGEELYLAMRAGERFKVSLRRGYAETGLELPDWLKSN